MGQTIEFTRPDGGALPPFEAGAHIDVVIAPEYQRAYSLAGDPADRSRYVLVLAGGDAAPAYPAADQERGRARSGSSRAGRGSKRGAR